MRIVVLIKPVPDTTGQERLGPDLRVDRVGVAGRGQRQRRVRPRGRAQAASRPPARAGDPPGDGARRSRPRPCARRSRWAPTRGVLVTDPALAGSDTLTTVRVLAAALRRLEYDLVLAGADTSDGGAGVVGAGVATLVGLPYLSYAAKIEPSGGRVRVRRISPTGYDVLEAPLPALVVATQALGEPRYPSLKGIMAARSKEIVTLVAGRPRPRSGDGRRRASPRRGSLRAEAPPARAATRVVREPARQAAETVVDFLAERRLI